MVRRYVAIPPKQPRSAAVVRPAARARDAARAGRAGRGRGEARRPRQVGLRPRQGSRLCRSRLVRFTPEALGANMFGASVSEAAGAAGPPMALLISGVTDCPLRVR